MECRPGCPPRRSSGQPAAVARPPAGDRTSARWGPRTRALGRCVHSPPATSRLWRTHRHLSRQHCLVTCRAPLLTWPATHQLSSEVVDLVSQQMWTAGTALGHTCTPGACCSRSMQASIASRVSTLRSPMLRSPPAQHRLVDIVSLAGPHTHKSSHASCLKRCKQTQVQQQQQQTHLPRRACCRCAWDGEGSRTLAQTGLACRTDIADAACRGSPALHQRASKHPLHSHTCSA